MRAMSTPRGTRFDRKTIADILALTSWILSIRVTSPSISELGTPHFANFFGGIVTVDQDVLIGVELSS